MWKGGKGVAGRTIWMFFFTIPSSSKNVNPCVEGCFRVSDADGLPIEQAEEATLTEFSSKNARPERFFRV